MDLRSRYIHRAACDRDAERLQCAHDPVYWLDTWGWTYDPRRPDVRWLPFEPWPAQAAYLRWLVSVIRKGGPAVVIKPRDVGASWLNAAFAVWCLCFLEGVSIGMASRKLMYVESGSPDSLFGKAWALLERLPDWLRPPVKRVRSPMPLIRNMSNDSEIKGEGGDNVGRGGRSLWYLLDEAAYLEDQESVESAVAESAHCVIWASTYSSPGNRFYELANNPEIPQFQFSWRDDPRKDDAWLERKRATTHEIHFQRDVLCNPDASLAGTLLKSEWVDAAMSCTIPARGVSVVGYDPAGQGSSEPIACQRTGPVITSIDRVPGKTGRQRAQWVASNTRGLVYYDASGGWGEEARAALAERGKPVQGGGSVPDYVAPRLELCLNMRAALYSELRWRLHNTWLRSTGEHVSEKDCLTLPRDELLRKQLLSIVVRETQSGKMAIESKIEMRKRGLPSPDRADAVCYSLASEVVKPGNVWVG